MRHRYSRQREAILEYLKSVKTHPTAECIYDHVRKDIPDISLGTVYRNLRLLEKQGKLRTISCGNAPERFDGDTSVIGHQHFICSECGAVIDVRIDDSKLRALAEKSSGCVITGHEIILHGICPDCKNKNKIS
ncbi:MAG: Fur family transcriptional regulator [Lachnospiraceae bacterium]